MLSIRGEFWYNYNMENRLDELAEFRRVLGAYHISASSLSILKQAKLALMVGPTSCGRNTIIKELVRRGGYHFLVSDTTRAKRVNDGVMERDGVEYWFRSERDVLDDLRAGKFLEAAIIHGQQVSGISVKEVQRAIDEGCIGITDIEIVGVDTIKTYKPDAHAIFVLPPSFSEWQNRLQQRGDMALGEKRRRMESAVHEFAHALDTGFYEFVINDKVASAAEQVQIITAGRSHKKAQERGKTLAMELLTETNYWLRHSTA